MEFVTNRTASDALMGNEKGSYSYKDLNRVESAVAAISAYVGLQLRTKTNWALGDLIFRTDMDRYLQNLYSVRDRCAQLDKQYIEKPLPGSMEDLTWEGANNIEKMLAWAYTFVRPGSELGVFVIGRSTLGGI